jgi:double-strand break repair protein MRE11
MRFLIASDVHLGHKEKHAVRGEDSFRGFAEVIEYAKERRVDFLLLGGDLFDEVNPSKECYFKCLSILREHVFGNVGSPLRVSLNGTPYRSNLDDPGLRVSLPIFTIHGNHDYPTNEFGKISACDLLQASNYVNYFGKHLDLRSIVIRPLIINKPGSHARIALYGLGYIKDQILNELFSDGKVVFEQPQGGLKDTFCLFVLHQNRYKKNFRPGSPLHQSFNVQNIPVWMGLVIWGHEHEAIYKLEEEYGRKIYQPGSTILTSYIDSECAKKQCLLVEVAPTAAYDLISLPLNRSFRPMKCLAYEYAILKATHG